MSSIKIPSELFKKYDVPAPRYTSYPTVPYWSDSPIAEEWIEHLNKALVQENASWSLYIHIPFCETLCTFCGCNTSITKNHEVESPYLQTLLKEWDLYKKSSPLLLKKTLKHLHLGGGTPTFFSPGHLKKLLEVILSDCKIDKKDFEGSIEVDPRRTSDEHLAVLKSLGFNRVSLGVQDFDPEVQRIVNRVQPYEQTKRITDKARELGFESVNYDLIYGLPKQKLDTIEYMANKTVELRPDRIALYSFALVPWIKPAQRLFKDEEVPMGEEKRQLYEKARDILLSAGYVEIGMDHFALADEALAQAHAKGTLHRNFMGYTNQKTDVLLGLGVSAISESPTCFHQNEKVLPVYEKTIQGGKIATLRGHKLSKEDQEFRQQILELMTLYRVKLKDKEQIDDIRVFLKAALEDGLAQVDDEGNLEVLEIGRPFLRNICMGLDQRMRSQQPQARIFSQSF
ncbi:MAG: oxygen-independent coproporphyrinogen III oxidase [Pseudobdellovibrionaceae bacterium]